MTTSGPKMVSDRQQRAQEIVAPTPTEEATVTLLDPERTIEAICHVVADHGLSLDTTRSIASAAVELGCVGDDADYAMVLDLWDTVDRLGAYFATRDTDHPPWRLNGTLPTSEAESDGHDPVLMQAGFAGWEVYYD